MTTITRTPMSRALLLASAASVATAVALAIMPIVPCAPATAADLLTPQIGAPAPDFTGTDSNGKIVKLGELRGRTVVLEWSNHECPFVGKHYRSGNMQALQKDATSQGAIWLTILSSAPGEQGNVTAAEANSLTEKRHAVPTAVVIDPSGTIGRLYGARTTPHMFVIDKGGILRYMGGIDDKPTTDPADIATARNYVRLALVAVAAGGPVADSVTRPYGCSIKYE
jgi:peroxiredoxin